MLEVISMKKSLGTILVILLIVSVGENLYFILENSNLNNEYNKLVNEYNTLVNENQEFQNEVLFQSEENYTSVTVMYYTNFGMNQQVVTLSISYAKYDFYHKKNHPTWSKDNLESAKEYITPNEPIIDQVVQSVENLTQSEEELANALLNLVQDKGQGLNIRYYPTTELKYPIETLVEMGGDCDTHSILYGTLMKAAGFDVLLLYSNEILDDGQYHVATAVHLENPPENSLDNYQDLVLTYNGKNYYYAETTNAYWRVGELPPKLENITFQIMPL